MYSICTVPGSSGSLATGQALPSARIPSPRPRLPSFHELTEGLPGSIPIPSARLVNTTTPPPVPRDLFAFSEIQSPARTLPLNICALTQPSGVPPSRPSPGSLSAGLPTPVSPSPRSPPPSEPPNAQPPSTEPRFPGISPAPSSPRPSTVNPQTAQLHARQPAAAHVLAHKCMPLPLRRLEPCPPLPPATPPFPPCESFHQAHGRLTFEGLPPIDSDEIETMSSIPQGWSYVDALNTVCLQPTFLFLLLFFFSWGL